LKRFLLAVTAVASLGAVAAGSAFGHARVLPALALDQTQVFTLSVPNEREDATTNKVVMTVPEGFTVRLFDPVDGWTREAETTGTGEDERVSRVTWTADGEGTDEGALFHFTAGGDAGTYTFEVEQTYSDGEVVSWSGPEDADEPASIVEVTSSLGGGGDDGSSWLTIVALVVGALGVVLGGAALARSGGRSLA
jgi:uncharacterized protein YcnI